MGKEDKQVRCYITSSQKLSHTSCVIMLRLVCSLVLRSEEEEKGPDFSLSLVLNYV